MPDVSWFEFEWEDPDSPPTLGVFREYTNHFSGNAEIIISVGQRGTAWEGVNSIKVRAHRTDDEFNDDGTPITPEQRRAAAAWIENQPY